jgi:hypothetical protein
VEDKQKLDSAQLSNIEDKFEALQKQMLLIANVVGITESSSAAGKGKAPETPQGRLYTHAEVKEIVKETAEATAEKVHQMFLEALKNRA